MAKGNEMGKRVASWDRIWKRWIGAASPEERALVLKAARAWSTRTGEPLPAVMQR